MTHKYIKVHVKNEDDLPKEGQKCICHLIMDDEIIETVIFQKVHTESWVKNIDWYLIEEDQPVQNEQSKDKNLYIERIENLQAIIRHCDSPSIDNPRFDMVLELTKKDKVLAGAINQPTTVESKTVEKGEDEKIEELAELLMQSESLPASIELIKLFLEEYNREGFVLPTAATQFLNEKGEPINKNDMG